MHKHKLQTNIEPDPHLYMKADSKVTGDSEAKHTKTFKYNDIALFGKFLRYLEKM